MELTKKINGIEFITVFKENHEIERHALVRGGVVELPRLKIKAFTLDKVNAVLDQILPIEAEMLKTKPVTSVQQDSPSQRPTPNKVKAKEKNSETLESSSYRNASFKERKVYEGRLDGCGERKDYGYKKGGNGPFQMRFCVDMNCNGELFRIWGAALPNILAASRAQIGDYIRVEELKAPENGMARHYGITKI